jgi:hypothetical protein
MSEEELKPDPTPASKAPLINHGGVQHKAPPEVNIPVVENAGKAVRFDPIKNTYLVDQEAAAKEGVSIEDAQKYAQTLNTRPNNIDIAIGDKSDPWHMPLEMREYRSRPKTLLDVESPYHFDIINKLSPETLKEIQDKLEAKREGIGKAAKAVTDMGPEGLEALLNVLVTTLPERPLPFPPGSKTHFTYDHIARPDPNLYPPSSLPSEPTQPTPPSGTEPGK